MQDKPDFAAMVLEVFRKHAPKRGDRMHREIVRLYLRRGWSPSNFAEPLDRLVARGWADYDLGSGFYVTTAAGEAAFAAGATLSAPDEPAAAPAGWPPLPPSRPPGRKRRRR